MIFISYRRSDSAPHVRSLSYSLKSAFGATNLFVDTDAVRLGDNWPRKIEASLAASTVLIVAIGKDWLKVSDEYGRRRIDDTVDWVRLEIKSALGRNISIIPLLFNGTRMPPAIALPKDIRKLLNHQSYEVRDNCWEQDVQSLLDILVHLGFKRHRGDIAYPKPKVSPTPLTTSELAFCLTKLDGWTICTSSVPGQEPRLMTELSKTFKFKSFVSAMDFMRAAMPFINATNHHPRWENVFSTVVVWLSTWDIGFQPSKMDVELAEHLDELYSNFPKK